MAQDITTIPTNELLADLRETAGDIHICEVALMVDITEYNGGTVQERLDRNREIQALIRAELARRAQQATA